MTTNKVVALLREAYEKLDDSVALIRSSEDLIWDTDLVGADLVEYHYWRGCMFFDVGAYRDSEVELRKVDSSSSIIQTWMQLKVLELLVACEIYNQKPLETINRFWSDLESASEEDQPLPIELKRACKFIRDSSVRNEVESWLDTRLYGV